MHHAHTTLCIIEVPSGNHHAGAELHFVNDFCTDIQETQTGELVVYVEK